MLRNKLEDFNLYLERNVLVKIEHQLSNKELLSLSDSSLNRKINLINELHSIIINENYKHIFNFSGLSNCWSYTNENNEFIYGGYLFNGFTEALAQESGFWDVYNSINKHEPDEKELEFLKKLNWFEKQAWGDDGKFGCFLREPGDFPPPIYFYDYGAVYPMQLTLEDYFDGMIASCGVRGWQYFYLDYSKIEIPDLPKVNKELIVKDLAFIVKMLPALFPDNDFSFHINKLEEIKKIL